MDHKRFAQSLIINTLLARTRYNAAGEQSLRKHRLVPFERCSYGELLSATSRIHKTMLSYMQRINKYVFLRTRRASLDIPMLGVVLMLTERRSLIVVYQIETRSGVSWPCILVYISILLRRSIHTRVRS